MILRLPFLGERNYLQGTTLLRALLSYADNPLNFSFKIEKVIRSNQVEVSECSGEHSASLAFGKRSLFVRELSAALPIRREVFDGQALLVDMKVEEWGGSLPLKDDCPPICYMVAAFKRILNERYPVPPRSGRWAFARLDAVQFSSGGIRSRLTLTKILCRDGRACCSVGLDGIPVATLYFFWVNI